MPITYGDSVMAKNVSTNVMTYTDSGVASQTYSLLPITLPAPLLTPGSGAYFATNWPDVSILPNAAPGAYSTVSYSITHSNGTSTAWVTGSSRLKIFRMIAT